VIIARAELHECRHYGAFVAATDDALEAIDALLAEGSDMHLRDLSQREYFRQARHRFDAAWARSA
jgi:hypothetical protein